MEIRRPVFLQFAIAISSATLIAFSLVFFPLSCTYVPDGVPETQIMPASPALMSISFEAMSESDTVKIYQPTYLRYSISGDVGKIIQVYLVFAGVTINSNGGISGTIDFSGQLLKSGTNRLTIGVITSSGSGSFADKLGEETFLQERSVMVYIDVSPPSPPSISFSTENGMLKITWSKYSKPNFVRYLVEMNSPTMGGVRFFDIREQEQTFYIDTEYFGGYGIEYKVGIESSMGTTFSQTISRSDSFDMTASYSATDTLVSLSWDRADFDGTFKEYVIIENGVPISSINDPNVHFLSFKPSIAVFGASGIYTVRLAAITGQFIESPREFRIPRFIESLQFSQRPVRFFYSAYLKAPVTQTLEPIGLQVHEQDWSIIQVVAGLPSEFVLAVNSPYFYTTDVASGRVIETDLDTGESKYFNVLPLPSHLSLRGIDILTVSSNRRVSYMYVAYNSDEKVTYSYNRVYDFAKSQHDFWTLAFQKPLPLSLSDDGKYLMANSNGEACTLPTLNCKGNVYEEINGVIQRVRQLFAHDAAFFRPGVPNEAISVHLGTVSVVDIKTGDIRQIPVPPGYSFANFDHASGYFFFVKEKGYLCYAVHIETLRQIEIPAYYSSIESRLELHNGYVIDQIGNYFRAIE